MSHEEIKNLIERYQQDSATPKERQTLDAWYNQITKRAISQPQEGDLMQAKADIWARLKEEALVAVPRKIKPIYQYAAGIAAAVALILWSIYFFPAPPDQVQSPTYEAEVKPGTEGATLTLANGKQIKLSDASKGELLKEAGVSVSKTSDGQIVYKITGTKGSLSGERSELYHTLSTGRGETYALILPDQSKVWLNSASSLTYSTSLNERGRRVVKLTGEAYFEIAREIAHPFVVQNNRQNVEVLGTHFNINSYPDEEAIRTTLLEGSVHVSFKNSSKVLKPGEQSVLTEHLEVKQVDASKAIDWKKGTFYFVDEDIRAVMRKLARWYNIDVVYKADVPDFGFGGEISMDKKLPDVLKMLETTERVHFKIEGRRVTVMK